MLLLLFFLLKLIVHQPLIVKRTDDMSNLPYKSTILFSKLR